MHFTFTTWVGETNETKCMCTCASSICFFVLGSFVQLDGKQGKVVDVAQDGNEQILSVQFPGKENTHLVTRKDVIIVTNNNNHTSNTCETDNLLIMPERETPGRVVK